jgi:hypothetical protein
VQTFRVGSQVSPVGQAGSQGGENVSEAVQVAEGPQLVSPGPLHVWISVED